MMGPELQEQFRRLAAENGSREKGHNEGHASVSWPVRRAKKDACRVLHESNHVICYLAGSLVVAAVCLFGIYQGATGQGWLVFWFGAGAALTLEQARRLVVIMIAREALRREELEAPLPVSYQKPSSEGRCCG